MSDRTRRLWEAAKSLLILLLALSAIFLAGTLIFQNSNLVSPPDPHTTPVSTASPDSVGVCRPIRMTVVNANGRYGVQYDDAGADELFDALSGLLAEALDNAQPPSAVSRESWESALSCRGIYFDFPGILPLSLAAEGLNGGETHTVLTAEATCLLLAEQPFGKVLLYYIDAGDGGYYACSTPLSFPEILNSYIPNGAFFAFQEPETYAVLDPDTLLFPDPPVPLLYTAAPGTAPEDPSARTALLNALDFFPQSNAIYPAADGWRVRDNDDILHLSNDGTVFFEAGNAGEPRYPVPHGASRAQMAALTSDLVQTALSAYCGSGRPYLIDISSTRQETVITYGLTLSGAEVQYGEDNWYARFVLREGQIAEYTLYLRRYDAAAPAEPLLPEYQAVAAMEALEADGRRLLLHYYDNGSGTVTSSWIAR